MNTTDFIIELSESPKTAFGKMDFAEQTRQQKIFTSVFGSSGSIFMDGFFLYFQNSDGETAAFAPEAFRAIKAPESARLIERASLILSAGPIPSDSSLRQAMSAALSAAARSELDDLDQEFYSTGEVIDDLLFDFIKEYPDSFGEIPDGIERIKPVKAD